jgi:hypothetical protein
VAVPTGTLLANPAPVGSVVSYSGLPTGLSYNASTGALTGTPPANAVGGYLVTITAGAQKPVETVLAIAAVKTLPVGAAPTQGKYPLLTKCRLVGMTAAQSDACMTQFINISLQIEGYSPSFALPAGYDNLTPASQLVAAVNALRKAYGLSALTQDAKATTVAGQAAVQGTDPDKDMFAAVGVVNVFWNGNWAAGMEYAVDAVAYWMYWDGLGGNNLDCTPADTTDCFGHRYNFISDPGQKGLTKIGGGYAIITFSGKTYHSFATAIY